MWTLSGSVDEISPDFTEQCRVASLLGLRYVELRSAWDVDILDLEPDRLAVLQDTLAAHDLAVSGIGTPIGGSFIDEPFPPHLRRMRHAAEVAHRFDAPYLRIFSFFRRPGADPAGQRDEVMDRMRALARIAEEADVVLLHQNEKASYGDVPARCLDIVRAVGSPHLRLAWNPANFVRVGVRPYPDGYAILRPHIEYVQITDARAADGAGVTAGNGDGELAETMRALRHDGFDGFFALGPHQDKDTATGGFAGPELFRRAWQDFTDLLKTEGIEYK